MYLIVAINKKTHNEFVYKKYKTENGAIKAFDKLCEDITLKKGNLIDFDFELHDCYGEIINATL